MGESLTTEPVAAGVCSGDGECGVGGSDLSRARELLRLPRLGRPPCPCEEEEAEGKA